MKIRFLISLPLYLISPLSFSAPPPGHPSIGDAATMMQLPDTQSMPYRGKVLEAINSNSYTYIHLQMTDNDIWLASPRLELNPGQNVGFPEGTMMTNFYSRKLKRTFDRVIFVRAVEILADLL